MSQTFIGVLKYRDFLKLWLSQATSQIALNMLTFAIVLHIYEITKSATSISLVLVASAIPSVLFGPFSGVVADRLNYKKILTYTNVFRFLAIIVLIFSRNNILALLEIVFLISLLTQFFAPAELASIPLVVPKERLVGANSVVMTTMYGAMLFGFGLAGPLMLLFSTKWIFMICALLYLLATLSVNRMSNFDTKIVKRIKLSTWARSYEAIWSETKAGLIHIYQNKKIFMPILKISVGWMMFGAFIVLLPKFSEFVLNISTRLIGLDIIVPAGLGMIFGSYYLDKKGKYNFNKAIKYGFIFCGLSLLVFSLYHYYAMFYFARLITVLSSVGLGFFSSIIYVSSQTLIHLETEENLRGRVFGFLSLFINLSMALPTLVIGGIADLTSTFAVMFFVALAVSLYGLFLRFERSR